MNTLHFFACPGLKNKGTVYVCFEEPTVAKAYSLFISLLVQRNEAGPLSITYGVCFT